jgi:hypothetical protein
MRAMSHSEPNWTSWEEVSRLTVLGPPDEGSWLSLPAAAKRLGVGTGTIRRWLDDGHLDGAQRVARWVTEESVERVATERRQDAEAWISLSKARRLLGCSDMTIAKLVAEELVVQRPGRRGQPSINRQSAERACGVLAVRRERLHTEHRRRAALRARNEAPDDGNVWLSVKTTALLLGRTQSGTTLRIRSGTLPATRRGRRWWVRREDAERASAGPSG